MATDGFTWNEKSLFWTLGELPAGQAVQYKLQLRCRQAVPKRVCGRVRLQMGTCTLTPMRSWRYDRLKNRKR